MTLLNVRKSPEPLNVVRERWDPFSGVPPSLLSREGDGHYVPDFDIKDNKEGIVLKGDVPGIKEGDLEISVTGKRLSISGKRQAEKEEKTDTYYTCERSYGSFTRIFTLPDDADADKIHARLDSGVLTVVIPHLPGVQPKKVAIKS